MNERLRAQLERRDLNRFFYRAHMNGATLSSLGAISNLSRDRIRCRIIKEKQERLAEWLSATREFIFQPQRKLSKNTAHYFIEILEMLTKGEE